MRLFIDPVWLAIFCLLIFCIINMIQERRILERVALATPIRPYPFYHGRLIIVVVILVAYLWAMRYIR
jgi:hypothetical protein